MSSHKRSRATEAHAKPIKVGAYLNVQEALSYLGIDRTRLYENLHEFDARKSGRRTLISRKSLDRWFERLPAVGPKGRRGRYAYTQSAIPRATPCRGASL